MPLFVFTFLNMIQMIKCISRIENTYKVVSVFNPNIYLYMLLFIFVLMAISSFLCYLGYDLEFFNRLILAILNILMLIPFLLLCFLNKKCAADPYITHFSLFFIEVERMRWSKEELGIMLIIELKEHGLNLRDLNFSELRYLLCARSPGGIAYKVCSILKDRAYANRTWVECIKNWFDSW